MRRFFRLFVLVLALLLIVAGSAAATTQPDGDGFHGYVDGWETGFLPAPFIPEGRCPAGTGWMLFTAGAGAASGYGPFTYTSEHCSWPVAMIEDGALGGLGDGVMVLTFAEGQVVLGYEGSWKFIGDLATGDGTARISQSYEVLGGTGLFADATGSGWINGLDDFHHILFDFKGSLALDD